MKTWNCFRERVPSLRSKLISIDYKNIKGFVFFNLFWVEQQQVQQPCEVILFIFEPLQRHPGTEAINYWIIPCWCTMNAIGPGGFFLITRYTLSYTGEAREAFNNI